MRIDVSEMTAKVPYPVFIPLGLPQGLRIDSTKGTVVGGVITRNTQRVVIDPLSYSLWLILQLGLSEQRMKDRFKEQLGTTDYDASMRTLLEKKLVHRLESYTELEFFGSVRVVPKATGVGSMDKEHALRYLVKPNFGDKEIVMNPLDYEIWTTWDGRTTLLHSWREAAKLFSLKLPDIIPRQVAILMLLLGQGLLNLD